MANVELSVDSFKRDDKLKQKHDVPNSMAANTEGGLPFLDTMSPNAAAAYLGIKVTTLAMWRSTKRYPLPYIKVGRLVQYRKTHLDAFLANRTVDLSA
jgi:excisionase family DNA binding protein